MSLTAQIRDVIHYLDRRIAEAKEVDTNEAMPYKFRLAALAQVVVCQETKEKLQDILKPYTLNGPDTDMPSSVDTNFTRP